ncbi:two-component system histidine kinase PnpS [Paenibacillus sp. J2TS4]|uniref:two-component system histidine kinase PnpS n=1 Tax=Paenibacillus sp. J2TS4 TaxID=2807194 RepID=UPI001B1BA2E7|nr:ATP-binding protein [Paenibacillus sp. J2TS4]GIP33718.1 PAS domain-containing sensor histidine kinase [Paenibacillus sp. J2TS4]
MTKFRTRLTVIFIVMIGLSVTAAGLLAAKLQENTYIQAQKENMERELLLILSTYDWRQSGTDEELIALYDERIRYLKESANARITVMGADGRVLGDSDHDPRTMDNHLDREEVREAKEHGSGYSIRYSETLDRKMLYVAIAADGDPSKQPSGYIRMSRDLGVVESALRKLWMFLGGGLAILFLIAGVISYRVAHAMTRPLVKITRVAQQITHRNSQSRVPIARNDEIGQLGGAINTMADSLQMQVNRIQENESRLKSVLDNMPSGVMMADLSGKIVLTNRAVEEILGFLAEELLGTLYTEAKLPFELKQMIRECLESHDPIHDEMIVYFPEERILEANVSPMARSDEEWSGILIVLHNMTAVRRLERVRSEFVANVSHELKTPVAAVKGFAETLLSGAMNDVDTARSFLQIIYDESERLNRLIGDILELSKIESRRIPLQFSPVDMELFVEQTTHVIQAEAEKKGIRLEASVTPNLFLEADEDRLRQIMNNLLSNGINYTPEGGRVRIDVRPADMDEKSGSYDKVRITISDTGMGIPKKDLPRIFERFYRVDKARSRSSGGTGLGLSIVKHLVELHKGTITVDSESGIGTTFIIELPVLQDS